MIAPETKNPDPDAWQDSRVCEECDGAGDIPGIREGDDDQVCPVCNGEGEI